MTKCKNFYKYKGVYPPKCNGGDPCETCQVIYLQAQRRTREDDDAMSQDCGFSSTIGTVTFNKDFWR